MMDSGSFETFKVTLQLIFALLSLIINSLLIYLIVNKSSKKMGNYRHLMIFFCFSSIFLSVIDAVVRPTMYSHGSAVCLIMDLREREIPVWLGKLLVYGVTGIFGVVTYGISIHFVYRYFALERNGRVRYFQLKCLPFWFGIPISGGIAWSLVSFYLIPMNPITSDYIRPTIAESFGLDVNQTVYICSMFLVPSKNGHLVFNWQCGIGFLCYLVLMSIPFLLVMIIGVKSHGKIRQFPVSKSGLNLQVQLFNALMAQTLIPVFILFIPFAAIFACPFFQIECDLLTTSSFFLYALYPVVDPLPNIYYIASYRKCVSAWIRCKGCRNARIYVEPESEVSRDRNSF